jgi:hypothetical protein
MKCLAVAGAVATVAAGLAACGSSPGPSYFVASTGTWVDLVQWTTPQGGTASGTITADTINTTGTDPSAVGALLGLVLIVVSVVRSR